VTLRRAIGRRVSFASAAVAGLALATTLGTGSAGASSARVFAPLAASAATDTSANWAGYAVTAPSTTYTSVTATWRQPKATCGTSGSADSAAFWVGLGGYSQASQALEQVGTSSDCDPDTGLPSYYAWYELVPNPSVTVDAFKVSAGDLVTTSVNVLGGTTVEVQIKDRTKGTVFTKKLPFASPDLSSAEWIAEAPSDCSSYRCRPIPLTDFGSVGFTRIAALGNGTGGTLTANPGWTTTGIKLVPQGNRGFYPGRDTYAGFAGSTAGATPSDASTDGRSFTVQWTADASGD
jgi:hypothetical protein